MDTRVLAAMEAVPRHLFVSEAFADQAYSDVALPIALGQSISPPSLIATMTVALGLGDRMKVLEIGTGSGYHTAILARLARRVYSIERHRPLAQAAETRLRDLKVHNVTIRPGDGLKGWREQALFDRILLTGAVPGPPQALLDELATGGILVAPCGASEDDQVLVRVRRGPAGDEREDIAPIRFVPFLYRQPPAPAS